MYRVRVWGTIWKRNPRAPRCLTRYFLWPSSQNHSAKIWVEIEKFHATNLEASIWKPTLLKKVKIITISLSLYWIFNDTESEYFYSFGEMFAQWLISFKFKYASFVGTKVTKSQELTSWRPSLKNISVKRSLRDFEVAIRDWKFSYYSTATILKNHNTFLLPKFYYKFWMPK